MARIPQFVARLFDRWCAIWNRKRSMLQSSIFRGLLEQLKNENDPAKRDELMRKAERQYDLDLEHQVNFVQSRIGNLEIDIREQVSTLLGNTNDMVSEVRDDGRKSRESLEKFLAANTAAVEGLRTETQAGFRDTYQQISTIGERVTNNEGQIKAVEGRMDRSEADRRAIHSELADAKTERATMSDTLARVELGLAQFIARYDERMARAGLTEEDIPELVDFVRDLKRGRESGNASR